MSSLALARAQMELSLGFHIVFAALGIGMPACMVVAEAIGLRAAARGDAAAAQRARDLARLWGKATALLFVVGAVSGTALSFELALLWPGFVELAGPALGPAFTLEGYAFLLEAIFLGLYLYGWDRLSPRGHLAAGVGVATTGCLSGILVCGANAWMQSPRGYVLEAGRLVDVAPFAVFQNPSWMPLAAHATFASYAAAGFTVAGVHAFGLLRRRASEVARLGLRIGLVVGAVGALLQPVTGDALAKLLHRTQPAKLAAMEALFETRAGAPLLVGGLPDVASGTVRYGIELPKLLSVLAAGDPDAVVVGLADVAPDLRPNPVVCHLAFQVMVGGGTALALASLVVVYGVARRRAWIEGTAALRGAVLSGPVAFLALEAGWIVTEAGRQPWIVYGVQRTAEAVTPRQDLGPTFALFAALYALLAVVLVALLVALARKAREEAAA